jgi:ferric-dicitrate binding protein FerR (iron transport regulator)
MTESASAVAISSGHALNTTKPLPPASPRSRVVWFAIMVTSIAIVVLVNWTAISYQLAIWRMQAVPDTLGRITLQDGTTIWPTVGSKVRVDKSVARGDAVRLVYLDGAARFSVVPKDTNTVFTTVPRDGLMIATRAGGVATRKGEFEIVLRADTMIVTVFRKYGDMGPGTMRIGVGVARPNVPAGQERGSAVTLGEGESARIYRNGNPAKIATPGMAARQ